VLAPATITGAAVFSCCSPWNCCVKATPKSILKPVYATGSFFGDSNTFKPRWSPGRMCWMMTGLSSENTDFGAAVESFVAAGVESAAVLPRSALATCVWAEATRNGIASAPVRYRRVFIYASRVMVSV